MPSQQARGLTLAAVRRWPPTVDVSQAARALGISRASAYAAIANGDFPVATIRVSRRLRVLTSSLVRVLENGETARSA
jgi:predicted DNA-binding transcriptional regulator AlpA